MMDQLHEETVKAEDTMPDEPETRVKRTIHSTLTKKFRLIITETQQVQTNYKNAVQSKIKRQLKIVKPEAPENEIDELSKDHEAANKVLNE